MKCTKGLLASILLAVLSSAACFVLCTGCSSTRTSESGNAQAVTITVWHPWGGTQKELLASVIAEFNRTHPGIHVEPLYTPNDSASSQKFFTSVAANRPPDVIFIDGPETAAWAEQGAIQPLDPYIKEAGIKESDYFVPSWKQNAYKGHVWALPYCADPNFAFAWNKKVFREVGLDPERPPKTLKELDEYNDRITKVENGRMVRIGFIPWAQSGAANSIFSWGWAFNGSFYDPNTNKITANDPNNLRALEWMLSYLKKYNIRKINAFTSGFGSRDQNPLYTGQMAMSFLHISQLQEINTYAPNLDYGLSYIPTPDRGEEHSSWVGGWCVGLPKGSKHPSEGWEFIRWCTRDPKGTAFVASKQGLMPGYKYSPYFKTIENKPGYGVFLKILRECKHQRPVMPAQSFYMSELDKVMDYTLYGKMTPKQALDMATKETQRELDLRVAGR